MLGNPAFIQQIKPTVSVQGVSDMRLFIAFDTSEQAKTALLEAQKQLKGDLTLTKHFHLTLKFLGETTPAQAEDIKKKLANVKFKPFTATLYGTGVFPEQGIPRVIWAGLEPHDIICKLQKQIEEALAGPKEKDFQPHITLARVKQTDKQLAEQVKKIKIEPISFQVKEFKLIESKLSQKGPEYKTIAEYR